jgi:hypothetical protein
MHAAAAMIPQNHPLDSLKTQNIEDVLALFEFRPVVINAEFPI